MFRVVPFPMYLSTVGFGGYALRFEISTDKKPHYSKLIGSKRKVNKRLAEFMDAELVVADVESIRLIRNVADSLLKAIEQKPPSKAGRRSICTAGATPRSTPAKRRGGPDDG